MLTNVAKSVLAFRLDLARKHPKVRSRKAEEARRDPLERQGFCSCVQVDADTEEALEEADRAKDPVCYDVMADLGLNC